MWRAGLLKYDEEVGIEWEWQVMDGAMTKAPLGGKRYGSQSHRPREEGHQAEFVDRGQGDSLLAEPLSAAVDPLGEEEDGKLPGNASFCLCLDYLPRCRGFRIGSEEGSL